MSETLDTTNRSVWPYPERSGVKTEDYLSEILANNEASLNPEDHRLAKQFAADLFEGKYSKDIECESKRNLEMLYQMSPQKSIDDFYLGYFHTNAGQSALKKLGISSGETSAIVAELEDIDKMKQVATTEERRTIAADSLDWYKDQLAQRLAQSDSHDNDFDDLEQVKVNYEPEKLVDKISDLQAFRRFFREVRRDIKLKPEGALHGAQEAILAAHRARVNEMIAGLYMDSMDLTEQLRRTGPRELSDRLLAAMPVVTATFLQSREDRVFGIEEVAGNFSRRLDFIRNGAAWTGKADFSPISAELSGLAAELEDQVETPAVLADLPSEIVTRLGAEHWNAEQLKGFIETVIGEWDLLSSISSTWDEVDSRDGFAADGKWQVVISPDVKSMSVSGSKRVVKIPQSFDRPLVQESPAGVISGVAHELTHLLQNEAAYMVGEEIPLAKIKGRHVSTMKELGTIIQERQAQARFGGNRKTNLHYLRALKVKLAGGNKLQTARAFYDSYTDGQSKDPKKDQRDRLLAVDRSLRLFRHRDPYSRVGNESQPLDYIEQELLRRKMDRLDQADRNQILILGSIFDLPDLARLSKTGLLHYPEGLPYNVADDVWRVFWREHPEFINQDK